jgi:hypothetical protein
MIRISNRNSTSHQVQSAGPQVQYVDRIVERVVTSAPIESIVHTVETKIVEVPIDRTVEVEKVVYMSVDLKPLEDKISDMEKATLYNFNHIAAVQDGWNGKIITELEMQRRALVAIKQQRDIDRSRRLMLIQRIKKEQKAHDKTILKIKLVVSASILLSILTFIIK